MPQYRITIEQIDAPQLEVGTAVAPAVTTERLRVTVDVAGTLDHAAILAAVTKTKRVYGPRKPKVEAAAS